MIMITEVEDYKSAKILKNVMDIVKKVGDEICALNQTKCKALEVEDFDTATEIKVKL